MQAQPRGKKRGAKENVTAGGKKTKKEEGEEEPKPFVCAIYRRDIASFLPREKVQQWRQTSSHSNASLIEFPSRLPRFKYWRLMVIFASGDRCIVQKNGFLTPQSNDGWMYGKEFSSIYDFRFCCRDVRDRASKLVGQRLFPNKPDNEGVAFKLYWHVNRREKEVVCRVPNLLTKKTAPAMLHFLHHLSQACYEYIEIEPGATADAAECTLNPLLLQALPKFWLRVARFGVDDLNNLMVKMAFEMRIRFNQLACCSFNFDEDVPQLLDFIANGRQLDKGLELRGPIRHQDVDPTIGLKIPRCKILHFPHVDQIIKYFEEDVHSLEGAIRDVRYLKHGNQWSDDWPARCPREAATQITQEDDGMVEHRFDYTNAHSKEPFSLLLGTRRHRGLTQITKFHLKFGSA